MSAVCIGKCQCCTRLIKYRDSSVVHVWLKSTLICLRRCAGGKGYKCEEPVSTYLGSDWHIRPAPVGARVWEIPWEVSQTAEYVRFGEGTARALGNGGRCPISECISPQLRLTVRQPLMPLFVGDIVWTVISWSENFVRSSCQESVPVARRTTFELPPLRAHRACDDGMAYNLKAMLSTHAR